VKPPWRRRVSQSVGIMAQGSSSLMPPALLSRTISRLGTTNFNGCRPHLRTERAWSDLHEEAIPDAASRSGLNVVRGVPTGEHPVHTDDQGVGIVRQMQDGRRGPTRRCEADHTDSVIRPAKMLGPSLGPGIEQRNLGPCLGIAGRGSIGFESVAQRTAQPEVELRAVPPFATGMMCSISSLAITRR
jgi:hypothetical protein